MEIIQRLEMIEKEGYTSTHGYQGILYMARSGFERYQEQH